MEQIGLYTQLTKFTNESAGTAEWCKAERGGKQYFVKKFHSPVYPSKEIGLPEKIYAAAVDEFHKALAWKKDMYQRLRESDQTGTLVIPIEVINYQFHICTVADFVTSNVSPEQVHLLSEWQRLVLMRTLTLALMSIHKAGVVHSDMKPDNIMITQDSSGHCKIRLIDFDGSFFESDPPTDPENVHGDPAFFAPEAYKQFMDESIRLDHRIDIFALGIIFHYFWTGKYPEKSVGKTIGECLLRDAEVTMDASVPPVLKQTITGMISVDPDKRISLESVYKILGIQIGLQKVEIIKLPDPPKAEEAKTPRPKDSKPRPSAEKTKETPEKAVSEAKPKDDKNKKAEVQILCYDQKGRTLRYRSLKLPYSTTQTVRAEMIDGYQVISEKAKLIRVLPNGYVDSPVVFVYKKEPAKSAGKAWKAILTMLALFAIYLLVVYILAQISLNKGELENAKRYMDAFPFYKDIFPNDYHRLFVQGWGR